MLERNINQLKLLKEHLIEQTKKYLANNTFTPWCTGFFGISGTTGEHRGKRFKECLNAATPEGVFFLIDILVNHTSAKNLITYLNDDGKMLKILNELKNEIAEDKNLLQAKKVFANFLNVMNYPAKDYKDSINNILKNFSYQTITTLGQEIKELDHNMEVVLYGNTLTQVRMYR
jgi:hypothetical protein